MLPTEIKVGHVFRYSYLWHWQYLEGREEGDKDRPCLVLALVTTLEDGTPIVRVLPISHTPPARADEAIEIRGQNKNCSRRHAKVERTVNLHFVCAYGLPACRADGKAPAITGLPQQLSMQEPQPNRLLQAGMLPPETEPGAIRGGGQRRRLARLPVPDLVPRR